MTTVNEHVDIDCYRRLRDRTNADIAADFAWRVPAKLNIGVEVCDRWSGQGRSAMRWLGVDGAVRDLDFDEMREMSDRAAGMLVALGVVPGDRVFTMLPRVPEHWAVLLGTLKAGAIWSCLSTTFGPDGVGVRVLDARPRVIVTTPAHEPAVRAAAGEVGATVVVLDDTPGGLVDRMAAAPSTFAAVATRPEDPAFLFYTSGTTGTPKGSLHGHGLLVGGCAVVAVGLDLRDDDNFWPSSDLAWITGVLLTLGAWSFGQRFVTYEGEFEPSRFWAILREQQITNFFTVPTVYRMLRAAEADAEGGVDPPIRHLGTVGEPLDPATLEWARTRFGVGIYECYGQTENGAALCGNRPGMEIKPGSLGPPWPWLTVAVVDENGQELPRGEIGEIVSRPDYPALTQGYWERPEASAAILRDGWHWTGDLAHMDTDGYVWFHSRADDVISSGGYRIGPTEIEAALLSHPAVAEAGVVGKPDPARGHVVKAWIALAAGRSPSDELVAELQSHCKATAGGWNYPREIEFLHELPKTITGKVRRAELRERDAPKTDDEVTK